MFVINLLYLRSLLFFNCRHVFREDFKLNGVLLQSLNFETKTSET